MVISQVPQEFTEDIIKEDSGAVNVRRITKMVDGRVVERNTIILAYEDTAPKEVFINLQRFNTSTYVPTPIRCNNCQLFGHKTIQCNKSDAVCPRCSARDHHFANCPAQNTEVKCANCGANHNVAYRGCHKYKQVRDTPLHSNDIRKLLVPRTHNKLSDRSFSAAGPRLWNELPPGLRRSGLSFDSFRRSLKTHLFGD